MQNDEFTNTKLIRWDIHWGTSWDYLDEDISLLEGKKL